MPMRFGGLACGVGMPKRLKLEPKSLILVEWIDAYLDLAQEGQPADFKSDNSQIAKTPGWFIKIERGKLFMGLDLWDQDPAKPIRSCHQIPLVDVLNVWSIELGQPVYSTGKAPSASPKVSAPGPKSKWATKQRSRP